MGLLSTPLNVLGLPLLFLVSFPLAIFAAITTGLALSLLAARASMVYFELAVALLHAYLFPEPPKPMPKRVAPPPSSPRVRRTSTASQDVAPAARLHRKSGSSASLLNASISASARDYEGVGGWRFYEGEEEEALWMGMNKRLQLPLALPSGRRHQRRHTGEEQRWPGSPEVFRMSPLQSRTRTPQRTPKRTASPGEEAEGDGYFPKQIVLRPLSTAMEPLSMSVQHSRRASFVSVGTSNSTGSSPDGAKVVVE